MTEKIETKGSGAKSGKQIQTIERAAMILDALSLNPRGMSIKGLSAELDLPKGTVYRLLSSLIHFGFARKDPGTRSYYLGFKLAELGHRLLNQFDIRMEARPELERLADQTRETVHLAILNQKDVVYIDKIESSSGGIGLKMASTIGLRVPAHATSVGKVLLAELSEEALDALLGEEDLAGLTDRTITRLPDLKEHLEWVRVQGFALDDEENEQGIRCVAAPIRHESGQTVAAVSISTPAFRWDLIKMEDMLTREVIQTASRVSKKLGFSQKRF